MSPRSSRHPRLRAERALFGGAGRFRTFVAAISLVALSTLSACEDPEKQANELFVGLARDLETTLAEPDPVSRIDRLRVIRERVDDLQSRFGQTAVAVRIAAGDRIGPLSRAELVAFVRDLDASPELCAARPTHGCVTEHLRARWASADVAFWEEAGVAGAAAAARVGDDRAFAASRRALEISRSAPWSPTNDFVFAGLSLTAGPAETFWQRGASHPFAALTSPLFALEGVAVASRFPGLAVGAEHLKAIADTVPGDFAGSARDVACSSTSSWLGPIRTPGDLRTWF